MLKIWKRGGGGVFSGVLWAELACEARVGVSIKIIVDNI